MMLGDMKVENSAEDRNNNNNTGRLFRRRILEVDNMDEVNDYYPQRYNILIVCCWARIVGQFGASARIGYRWR